MVSERAAFMGNRRDYFPRNGRLARKDSWGCGPLSEELREDGAEV